MIQSHNKLYHAKDTVHPFLQKEFSKQYTGYPGNPAEAAKITNHELITGKCGHPGHFS